ncbi:MAG: AAA family ATPase, partial [Clostridia bacterium]|nr:AAA family ATPase [Clostridia bacterium]
MKFKRVELIGFKSFADKTVINFDDGITAIVGPNGCGKSNVADAIRWVLGEQSSKLLRGSSMQDVIFNGTQTRKSLSYCEVSLVLDNADHAVDLDYNEVILTRKLYRSGESEYLINNNTARLKDIVDILHDVGIGRGDGYSIIGQGKVEQIVSSKPENRRGIFEEAAGISKFKEKKLESERKLARTRDNIARLRDILIEIERQLNPLKEQAEKARKYLDLREELKSLEINNYIYQYDSAASNKQEISTRINALAEEIDDKQKKLDDTIANYNKNYEDIQKIDKTIKELYDQVVSLTVQLERKSGEATIVKEKLVLLRQQAEKLDAELKQEQQNIAGSQDLIAQKEQKIQENKKNIE